MNKENLQKIWDAKGIDARLQILAYLIMNKGYQPTEDERIELLTALLAISP